ncbi:MAG TPA: AAA family ATPase [Acidimicrobiia bacterium]|nr:AAA family ATPase [Acidimicrobiia bacterium]
MPSHGAYLPLDRRRELAGLGELAHLSHGAALFADISGFTRLTEELGRTLGPRRGAEELTVLLNRVFGSITAVINDEGGSIISFGGDSVTAWFHEDDGWRATAVGHRLMNTFLHLRDTETGPARTLDIKVAVASGTALRLRVGRPTHSYMDVLAGAVNDSLVSESSLLQPGELAVSASVAAVLKGRAKVRSVPGGGRTRHLVEEVTDFPPPPPPFDPADSVSADEWLHPLVRDHLQQGLGSLMGQLRDVVTMFVGFEDGDSEDSEHFAEFVARAQEVIASFEGMVLQVLVDEKGSHLYAVFGASIAHEDEATRAVVAAQNLVGSGANPSRVRVGIAAGTVYVGAYGGHTRMTFGVMGPSVNLAARLMQEAPTGSIYVSEDIARQRTQQVQFDEIGRAELRGIDQAVPIFCTRPTAARAGEARAARSIGSMIGRSEERALLAAGLAGLQSGQGGTFIVEGAAGIGKTRLIADFVERAEMMATRVITTAGEEIDHATAFFAWTPVLRQLFGGNDVTAEAKLLDFMAADPWRAARVGLLESIISTPVEDTYLTAGMEPGLRMENTYQLLTAIVRDAPRSAPLVLVLDDGHWMDSSSWAMAERVGREIPSLMVVIGTRPFSEASGNLAPDEYRKLLEDSTTTHIMLGELEPTEALELVEISLGVTDLPGPVSELIVEQAGGHPYFAEEIGFALRDAGLLIVENGESRLAPEVHDLGDIDFPQSVQEVIRGRFDRLSVMEQTMLKVASVIGREFDAETLAEVYPVAISREHVEDTLETLVPLDLIQPVVASEGHYRFRHAITRDIAYGLLLYSQRHQLHASAARWMESWHADDPDSVLAPLAYHSRNSLSPESSPEEVDRALQYLGRAGRKSLRSFAHREAIGFLNDAITIASGEARTGDLTGVKPETAIPDRVCARWEQDLAEAHLGMGRVEQSAIHFERALQLHGHPMGKGKLGVGVRLLGAAALQAGHRVTRFQGGDMDPDKRDDLIEAATAYERLMKIYYYANDPGSLITAAVSGLNLAERAGTSPVLARIYANMSIVSGIVPVHKLARTYARRSREVADEVDQMPEHAWVRLATSVYGVGVGEWEQVEPELRESYDLYKQLSDWRQLAETLGTTGQMLTAQGRFVEAYSVGEELRELGAWRDDAQAEMWGWLYQGSSLLRQGDPREAINRLRNGERLLQAGVGGANVGWLYGVMAETYRRLDDPDRARAAAVSAGESLYSERPGVVFVLDGFTGAAEAQFGLLKRSRARSVAANKAAAEKAVKKLIGYSRVFPIGRPAALRYTGRLKEHAGDVDGARSDWMEALEAAQALGMPFEEGLSSLNIGRLDGDSDRLTHALGLFESVGARHFIDVAGRALRG